MFGGWQETLDAGRVLRELLSSLLSKAASSLTFFLLIRAEPISPILLPLSSSLNCLASQPSPSRVNYQTGCPQAIILRRGGQAPGKGDSTFPGISAQRKPMLPQEALGSQTGAEVVRVTGQMRVSLCQGSFAGLLEQRPEYLRQELLSSS